MNETSIDHLYGTDESRDRLREAFSSGTVPVAVYGLGKMGLPLATVYAETCGDVVGVDVDPAVVEAVNDGECPVQGEPGLSELLDAQVDAGRMRATTAGREAAATASVHVVIVPTLVTDADEPDLSLVESVARDVAAGLEPGDLVIAESTLPPGTCRDVVRPLLAAESGLDPDGFGLACCPERTSSGTALRDIRGQYPKVVGGVDDESTRAAAAVYDELSTNDVRTVSDATTAETIKVFEGVYRDVNIALANELAGIAGDVGVSVREAIDVANDLPMCHLHDPGPGVGGHCIPYYPHFLASSADRELDLVGTARSINDRMPRETVSILERELESAGDDLGDANVESLDGAEVLVLGLTYRPGIAETRASPALGVIDELRERGAEAFAADPLVDPSDHGARPVDLASLEDRSFDAAILVTPHDEFDRIDWDALEPLVVLDGRDATSLEGTRHRAVTLGGSSDGGPTAVERWYDDDRARSSEDVDRSGDGDREERAAGYGRTDGGEDVAAYSGDEGVARGGDDV